MKLPRLAAAVLSLAGLAACGTQAGGQPPGPAVVATATAGHAGSGTASPAGTITVSPQPPAPSPSPRPSVTGPGALTTADSGATVRLRPGQRVTVALASEGLFSWHVPAAAGAAVRRVSASGGYPGRRPARAVFVAVRPGSATLTATDDTACLHARPACLPAQRAWQVTVIVTGR